MKLELPNNQAIPSALFSGRFSYKIEGNTESERLMHLNQVINDSGKDFGACKELVTKNFLDS